MSYDFISSKPAFDSNKHGKDYCRQMVFIAIRKLGPCNDRELSERLQWPINRITPRRGELVTGGLIVMDRKDTDPKTGRTVSYWKVKPVNFQPKLF